MSFARRAIAPDSDVGTRKPSRASRSAGVSASGTRDRPEPLQRREPWPRAGRPTVRCPVNVLCRPGPTSESACIAAPAVSRKSSVRTLPSGDRYTMNPPPPMPQDCGRATPSANTVVTAASIALPPRASTSRPARAAAGDSVATTPLRPLTPGWMREPSVAGAVDGSSATAQAAAARRTGRRVMGLRYPRSRDVKPARQPRNRARQRLDEVLELLGGPALEGLAVLLVGGDHRVAVVPVQPRLGVQPERAPGLGGDLGEDVGARVAAVRARVAEDDDRRARVQVVLDERRGTRSTRGRSRCSRRCRRRRRRAPIASRHRAEVALLLRRRR